jgi:hypothetical protein
MALSRTLDELRRHLQRLREALHELELAADEDRPRRGEAVLVDLIADAALVSRGWVEESLRAARQAQQAVERPADLEAARQAIGTCQERFGRVAMRLLGELLAYEQVDMLTRLGRERGGEWSSWAGTVRTALERCRQPLLDANQGLFECCQELVERALLTPVTVQAIGQQFAPAPIEREAEEVAT